jgi:hypothetical protein
MSLIKAKGGFHLLVVALLIGFAALAVLPGAGRAQDRTDEDASIRFVHASPDAPAIDVIVDGAPVAENVAFSSASDYLPFSAGEHQVQIVPTGSGAESAVLDETVDLDGGGAYIFAAAGLLNEIEAKTYEVDLDDLDENQSRVRLVHLSPDTDSVDLYVTGGDEWFDDVDFPNASDYKDVDSGSYDLEVRAHDSETVALTLSGFEVQPGRALDVLVLGQSSDNSLTALTLETRASPACGAVIGDGTDDDACVRVIHTSIDAPAVDVYVNDSLVIENLAFGSATDFAPLPSGDDRNIKIVPTGSPLDAAVVDTNVDLDAGQAYDLIAFNRVDDIDVKAVEVNLDPVPVGQARLRVLHEAPDSPDVDVVITDGPALFEGVGTGDETDYTIVDAGTYDLQLKDGDDVVARIQELQLDENMSYDIVVIGSADDNTLQVISLAAPTAAIEGGTPQASAEAGGESLAEEATAEVVSTPTQ